MRIPYYLFCVFVFLSTFSIGQIANEEVQTNVLFELNGQYAFSVDGIDHQVIINSQLGTFIEQDNQGQAVGNGTVYLEDNIYVFVPVQTGSESLILAPLNVKIIEKNYRDRLVDVRYHNERNGRIINMESL